MGEIPSPYSTKFFMKSTPTDMRKGYEGLASIVRDVMGHNPRNYNEAFVFYSKDYRKVKILHYDINGWVLCSKWFTDGKFLKPEFEECKITHELSRETLILIPQFGIKIVPKKVGNLRYFLYLCS